MFMFFRMISGFGVMDQSSSTLTGVLVSRLNQEELNIAWRWATEVIYISKNVIAIRIKYVP